MANDVSLLQAALLGYEQQRAEIVQRIADLRHQLGGRKGTTPVAVASVVSATGRRPLSAVARKRIAAAQRKRWKQFHQSQAPEAKQAAAPKRKMSAAAKKRIADAAKKRWAAFRAKKAAGATEPKVKTAAG